MVKTLARPLLQWAKEIIQEAIQSQIFGAPPRPRKWSPLQMANRRKFDEAAAYGRRATADDGMRNLYQARVNRRMHTAFVVAFTDYLTPPEVSAIDTESYRGMIGDEIQVRAFDDFGVTTVKVRITNAEGALLEEGDAKPDLENPFIWNYVTTVANPRTGGSVVCATAYDRPGNRDTMESRVFDWGR